MPAIIKLIPQPQEGWNIAGPVVVPEGDLGLVLGRLRTLGIGDTAVSRQQCSVTVTEAGVVELVPCKGVYLQRTDGKKEPTLVTQRRQVDSGDKLWLLKKANKLLYGFEVTIISQDGPATPPARTSLPKRASGRAGVAACKRLRSEPPITGSGIFAGLHLVFWVKSHMKQALARAQAAGAVVQPEVDARTTHVIAEQCISPQNALGRLNLPLDPCEPGKSPLPDNIAFVTRDWVSQCLARQKLLPTDTFLVAIQRSYSTWKEECGPAAKDSKPVEDPAGEQEAGEDDGSVKEGSPSNSVEVEFQAASPALMGKEEPSSSPAAVREAEAVHLDSSEQQLTGGDSGLPWGAGGEFVEPWNEAGAQETLRKLDAHWHRLDLKDKAAAGEEGEEKDRTSLARADSLELETSSSPGQTNGVCGHVACSRAAVCLVDALQTLYQTYGRSGVDNFRRKAADRAIRTLVAADKPISSERDVHDLGVGEKTRDKLIELLTTGHLRRNENFKASELCRTLQMFSEVWGCAERTAERWWMDGCRTLDDVRKRHDLTEQQTAGLKYFEDLKVRIPREEVARVAAEVEAAALDLFGWDSAPQHDRPHIRCTGSYLRGKPATGDVDMLLIPPSTEPRDCAQILHLLLTRLHQQGLLLEDMGPCRPRHTKEGSSSSSFMGFCSLPGFPHVRRFDIKCYPRWAIACAVNYFTGSGAFNRALRLWAQNSAVACAAAQKLVPSANGFKLSDTVLVPRSLTGSIARGDRVELDLGPQLEVTCETDIFRALGLEYVPPHRRFFYNFQ